MRLLKLSILLFFFLSSCFYSSGQDSLSFDYQDYFNQVKNSHPIAYQAQLKAEEIKAVKLKGKSGFDPKIGGSINQKYFEGKPYYSHQNSALVIPTWFGIKLEAGYQNNAGIQLNPEDFTNNTGLWNAGVSVNLGRGLIIDQRRADLQQAKVYANSTLLEQKLILNKLFYDASIAYLEWSKAHYQNLVFENALNTSLERFNNIKENAQRGDKASIDTLKAFILVQNRRVSFEQSKINLENKRINLETYLWQDGFIPLELAANIQPEKLDSIFKREIDINNNELDSLVLNHAEYLMATNKIEISKIDYRLKRENLKPKIELKYQALNNLQDPLPQHNLANYTWGGTVAYPIFTRKARSEKEFARLRLGQQKFSLNDKKTKIKYKILSSLNQYQSFDIQEEIYNNNLKNYQDLYQAEFQLFTAGESTMFLVNTRDQNLLEAEIKYLNLLYKKSESKALLKFHTFDF